MVSEVSKVLMVLVIILLAFALPWHVLGQTRYLNIQNYTHLMSFVTCWTLPWACVQAVFANFGAALKSLSQLMLNLDPPVFDLSSQAAAIFLIAFVLVSVIGVLNILIAQVSSKSIWYSCPWYLAPYSNFCLNLNALGNKFDLISILNSFQDNCLFSWIWTLLCKLCT